MLLVGTAKGLFRLWQQGPASPWRIDGPHIAGYEVLHTCAAPDGTLYASTAHKVWGAHVYRSTDDGASWVSLYSAPRHPPESGRGELKAIWCLAAVADALYAGTDPAGLFHSADSGKSWQPVDSLNEHPTRATWEPSRGCFAVHTVCVDPLEPRNLWAAVSAGGVYRSTDRGVSWSPANVGVRATNLPDPYPETGHNVHRLVMHPLQPERLYRQCYSGTYRSDDGARTWIEITDGLPSDFGYALAVDRNDPDTVFQIPESGSHLRAPVDGKLRVFRSSNAGGDWHSVSEGLPQSHVYVTVLREAMDTDGRSPCGVYFGTSGGSVFASHDAGGVWTEITTYLPRILSVKALAPASP